MNTDLSKQLRTELPTKQYQAPEGMRNYVPKMTIINHLTDTLGMHGVGWSFTVVSRVQHADSVTVTGILMLMIGFSKHVSPELTGCAPIQNSTVGDAFCQAENICFKRTAGFFGIGSSEDAETTGEKTGKEITAPKGELPDDTGNRVVGQALTQSQGPGVVIELNKTKETPAVATPAVATPAVATPAVATPAVATPAVATPDPIVVATDPAAPTPAVVDPIGFKVDWEKFEVLYAKIDMIDDMKIDLAKKQLLEIGFTQDFVLSLPDHTPMKRVMPSRIIEALKWLKSKQVGGDSKGEKPEGQNSAAAAPAPVVNPVIPPDKEDAPVVNLGGVSNDAPGKVDLSGIKPAPRLDVLDSSDVLELVFNNTGCTDAKSFAERCKEKELKYTDLNDFAENATEEELEKFFS